MKWNEILIIAEAINKPEAPYPVNTYLEVADGWPFSVVPAYRGSFWFRFMGITLNAKTIEELVNEIDRAKAIVSNYLES
jgi:hypothetical protein